MNFTEDDDQVLTLKSSISAELISRALLRGTLIASFGMFAMLYAAIFLPVPQLKKVGIFIFFFAVGATSIGMLKYRRLLRMERNPFYLKVDKTQLTLERKGFVSLEIPWDLVRSIRYRDQPKKVYGIEIVLKTKLPEKSAFQENNLSLFFPYFTLRSFKKVEDYFCKKIIEPS